MGYRIEYTRIPNIEKINQSYCRKRTKLTFLFFSLFTVVTFVFWPQGREMVLSVLLPCDRELLVQVAESFASHLVQGQTVPAAFAEFWRDIVGGIEIA